MKPIRISDKNHKRLALVRDGKSLTSKLDEILNLYFENGGGELERDELDKKSKKLLPPK